MRSVLVTDGELRSSLAVVRSLGRAGYRCHVCSTDGASLAGSSRYVYRDHQVVDVTSDEAGFVASVVQVVERENIQMVIPTSEASILALLPSRAQISAHIPLPELEVFSAVCNKAALLDAAREIGIRVPRQRVLTPDTSISPELEFPVVLKPHASMVRGGNRGRTKVGVTWVQNAPQLQDALSRYPDGAYPILAQEVIHGPGIGIFVLLDAGHPVASFSHHRIREKPPTGGVSVLSESTPINAELLEVSCRLLNRYGWSGVAMVEYKIDGDTGEPVLMEINGRFWGSVQLAVDAGVDFPRLLADLHFGESVGPMKPYGSTRLRWFWGDVDNLITQWRHSSSWSLRLHALAAWVGAFGPGNRSEVFRWDDPLPALRESVTWFANLRRS